MSSSWERYNELLGFNLEEKMGSNPKEFLKTYKFDNTLSSEEKGKLELLISISKDMGNSQYEKGIKGMGSSKEAVNFFTRRIGFESVEHFEAMYLDKKYHLVKAERVSTGLISQSLVDVRKMLKSCLEDKSIKYVVTAHNHPSGNPTPSQEDLAMQQRLREVFPEVGVRYLDNVIVGYNGGKSIFDSEPYYRQEPTEEIKLEETFLSKGDAEKMVQRGGIENLALEEKISVLTQLTPFKLQGIFIEKDISDIKLTKDAKEVLSTIKSFHEDIERLYATPYNPTSITNHKAVGQAFYNIDIPGNKIAVASLSTKCQIVNITQFEQNMMLTRNILDAAIKNGAYGIVLVSKDPDLDSASQCSKREDIERVLKKAGIQVLDYINYESRTRCFSAAATEEFTVQESKGPLVNQMQQNKGINNNVEKSIIPKGRILDLEM